MDNKIDLVREMIHTRIKDANTDRKFDLMGNIFQYIQDQIDQMNKDLSNSEAFSWGNFLFELSLSFLIPGIGGAIGAWASSAITNKFLNVNAGPEDPFRIAFQSFMTSSESNIEETFNFGFNTPKILGKKNFEFSYKPKQVINNYHQKQLTIINFNKTNDTSTVASKAIEEFLGEGIASSFSTVIGGMKNGFNNSIANQDSTIKHAYLKMFNERNEIVEFLQETISIFFDAINRMVNESNDNIFSKIILSFFYWLADNEKIPALDIRPMQWIRKNYDEVFKRFDQEVLLIGMTLYELKYEKHRYMLPPGGRGPGDNSYIKFEKSNDSFDILNILNIYGGYSLFDKNIVEKSVELKTILQTYVFPAYILLEEQLNNNLDLIGGGLSYNKETLWVLKEDDFKKLLESHDNNLIENIDALNTYGIYISCIAVKVRGRGDRLFFALIVEEEFVYDKTYFNSTGLPYRFLSQVIILAEIKDSLFANFKKIAIDRTYDFFSRPNRGIDVYEPKKKSDPVMGNLNDNSKSLNFAVVPNFPGFVDLISPMRALSGSGNYSVSS